MVYRRSWKRTDFAGLSHRPRDIFCSQITGKNVLLNVSTHFHANKITSAFRQVVASAQSPPIYGFCDVTVTIEDVNDNAPTLRTVYLQNPSPGIFDVVTIPHSLSVTTEIYAVDGFDADEGQNSVVCFLSLTYAAIVCKNTFAYLHYIPY